MEGWAWPVLEVQGPLQQLWQVLDQAWRGVWSRVSTVEPRNLADQLTVAELILGVLARRVSAGPVVELTWVQLMVHSAWVSLPYHLCLLQVLQASLEHRNWGVVEWRDLAHWLLVWQVS